MLQQITIRALAAALFSLAMALAGCGSDDSGDDDDGSGGAGSDHGSVGAGATGGTPQGDCFEAFPGDWALMFSGGPSQCKGFGPIECTVSQTGCMVTIESEKLGGAASVKIDENGVTESTQVPIGDGIIATCHAEFDEEFGTSVGDVFSMTLVCSAMGVDCEYGESKIFTD